MRAITFDIYNNSSIGLNEKKKCKLVINVSKPLNNKQDYIKLFRKLKYKFAKALKIPESLGLWCNFKYKIINRLNFIYYFT